MWAAAALLLWPELFLLAGSRRPDVPQARGHCLVLVLGNPGNADGTPTAVQSYRVRSGAEALERYGCAAMILSGGKPHSELVEADVMARAAQAQGVPKEKLILERDSRNTWENIKNSLPNLPAGDYLFIASDASHAWRARRYLCVQRPDVCPRARAYSRLEPATLPLFRWEACYYNLVAVLRDALKRSISGKVEW